MHAQGECGVCCMGEYGVVCMPKVSVACAVWVSKYVHYGQVWVYMYLCRVNGHQLVSYRFHPLVCTIIRLNRIAIRDKNTYHVSRQFLTCV